METPETTTPSAPPRRRTRSAAAIRSRPQGPADDTTGEAEDTSPHARQAPLITGLLGLLAHLLTARMPGLMAQAKEAFAAFLHPKGQRAGAGVPHRLADAGSRVVAWGREHPGQAVAVGAAVLTAVVLVGVMVHRSQVETSARPAARRARKQGKHAG